MGLSSAMQWWEEWQLRILVLGSLSVQCYLALFASSRKKHIKPLYRLFIWLAYLGSDALAIYALATLFNRNKKDQHQPVNGSRDLEVLWAPILLIHLGGPVNISAYNIEDNELWRRHILTAVSQVVVVLYVFCKSWSSSADKRLLAAAILLFIIGIFKCFDKPSALKRASFNSIVTTFDPAPRIKTAKREVELKGYIQDARSFVQQNKNPPALDSDSRSPHKNQLSVPDKLFVDYAYVYDDRLTTLKSFWLLDEKTTYDAIYEGLSETFNLIYSKRFQWDDKNRTTPQCGNFFSGLIIFLNLLLPIVPVCLFHSSHKTAYRGSDIKVTFILLYVTYFLEISSFLTLAQFDKEWSDGVAQHSLIGFLACNRRHARLMGIAEFFQCKGLLDTYFGLMSYHSSKDITMLVREHVKAGWMSHITDIKSYWRFCDSRGQWALERDGGEKEMLLGSIDKPFDESIILWHLATEFCFYMTGTSPDSRICTQISNYMMHLLCANTEMLLPGSRRNLFTVVCDELEAILQGDDDLSVLDERRLTQKIISKAESAEGFIRDSWVLAQELMLRLGGTKKTWEVIKAVWIEMLCFSAGRCRGYLHAKSLGSGGEYLTFVALLMSHAGLETYAERQQRVHLRHSKEERVKIAEQRIQGAAKNQATGGSLTFQSMAPVKDEEIATTPLASQVNGQLEQEEDAASTSALRVECVAPAAAIKIVVSP
ncbi:uncharacterized protein [Miscanthus floridulus]|uniref:uncharacterized protein n=1 Tax=Miscanthus floridulus TaxID=154761 RepID=UPI003459394A